MNVFSDDDGVVIELSWQEANKFRGELVGSLCNTPLKTELWHKLMDLKGKLKCQNPRLTTPKSGYCSALRTSFVGWLNRLTQRSRT